MKYVKNFNNNAALVVDDAQCEWVVIGTGVGFGKKKGDEIDESQISRRFKSDTEHNDSLDLMAEFPAEITDATMKVVNATEAALDVTFSDYQYLILVDHIHFAYERRHENLPMADGTTKWKVSKLFPAEFKAAQQALLILNIELCHSFAEEEAIFLTYHFVSVGNEKETLQDTIEISNLINDVINIVQLNYQMTLDADSFNYSRFVSHLRYFFIKMIKGDIQTNDELDDMLLAHMVTKYPKEYQTVQTINQFLTKSKGWTLSLNDEIYLTLHVWRVTHRELH